MLHSLSINIDRFANIPITRQITEQLILCIQDGTLAKGQMLPSIRQIADFLGINRNTAVAVYRALEQGGYITTTPGTGSFVSNKIKDDETRRSQEITAFIHSVFEQAQQLGISAKEIGSMIYYESLRYRHAQPLHVLVLESFSGELDFYCAELSSQLGINASGILLQDIKNDPDFKTRVQAYDFAITPFYLHDKCEHLLKPYNLTVVCIGAGPALASLVSLSHIPHQKKIAIICTEKTGSQYMVDALEISDIKFENKKTTWVHDTQFKKIVNWADVLIVSEGAMSKVKGLSSDKEIFNYAHVLDRTNLSMLQRFVADLLEQREHKPENTNKIHQE